MVILVEPIPVYEVRVAFADGDFGSVRLYFSEHAAQEHATRIKQSSNTVRYLDIVDAFVAKQWVR